MFFKIKKKLFQVGQAFFSLCNSTAYWSGVVNRFRLLVTGRLGISARKVGILSVLCVNSCVWFGFRALFCAFSVGFCAFFFGIVDFCFVRLVCFLCESRFFCAIIGAIVRIVCDRVRRVRRS